MFQTLKSKILSGLIILGALIQPASARSMNYELPYQQSIKNIVHKIVHSISSTQHKPQQQPLSDYGWPIGTGLMTFATLFAMKKLNEPIDTDELHRSIPDLPVKPTTGNINLSVKNESQKKAAPVPFQISDQKLISFEPPFDPLAIRSITHEEKMSNAERDLLADRLHAIRKMEDINRERALLTRRMAKAKKENDTATMQTIASRRKELSNLRKQSFATAAGPLWNVIKEERRLLTKKMTQARRNQDLSATAEINKRRSMLKTQEELLKLTVRDFKYKSARPSFIKKKQLPVGQIAQLVTERYRIAG